MRIASSIKPHLVETLAGVVARNQLSNVIALKLTAALLKVVSLKVTAEIRRNEYWLTFVHSPLS